MRDPPIDMELDRIDRRGPQQALLAVLGALFFVAGFGLVLPANALKASNYRHNLQNRWSNAI
jgi:hypothetical protein